MLLAGLGVDCVEKSDELNVYAVFEEDKTVPGQAICVVAARCDCEDAFELLIDAGEGVVVD